MCPFDKTRALFQLPDGIIYLDGNSLGPMPVAAPKRLDRTMQDEWSQGLIASWNRAGWMQMPGQLGNRIARLIGAAEDSVSIGDTLSIKIYQALSAALQLRPERRVVLSDTGNFPTDLYMAQGLIRSLDNQHHLKAVPPETIQDSIDETVAAVLLTQVDYRTGRLHDMARITRLAHEKGALVIWDLAHSAGAMPIELSRLDVDFAAGCTYKYFNAGPGSPAFIHVAPRLQSDINPALSGWHGHHSPFDFDLDYCPAEGVERMRIGTPAVLQMAVLDAALDVFDGIDMNVVRQRSIELSELLIELVESKCPMLKLASPRDSEKRGSQVSFEFEQGYAAMQAIICKGVVGDFRAPNIMRFGITPLYISEADILKAADIIENVMTNRLWDKAEFKQKKTVT